MQLQRLTGNAFSLFHQNNQCKLQKPQTLFVYFSLTSCHVCLALDLCISTSLPPPLPPLPPPPPKSLLLVILSLSIFHITLSLFRSLTCPSLVWLIAQIWKIRITVDMFITRALPTMMMMMIANDMHTGCESTEISLALKVPLIK